MTHWVVHVILKSDINNQTYLLPFVFYDEEDALICNYLCFLGWPSKPCNSFLGCPPPAVNERRGRSVMAAVKWLRVQTRHWDVTDGRTDNEQQAISRVVRSACTNFEISAWCSDYCKTATMYNKSAQSNLGRGPRRGAVAHIRRNVPIGYNAAPQFRPKSTPSRGSISKPHCLPHPWSRPTYDAKRASGSDPPFCHNALDRPTDRQIVHGKVWRL